MSLSLDFGGAKLGCTVKDLSTGISGIATQFIWGLAGWRQIAIQPLSSDGRETPKLIAIDYQMTEIVDEGISAKASQPRDDIPNWLGQIAKDEVTGAKGTVTEMLAHLNGCVTVFMQPKASMIKGDVPDQLHFDHKRIKIEKDGPAAERARAPAAAGVPDGPSARTVSRKMP